ncbi:AMP-binding protein [Streptomyces sp. NPDC021080]|uniref:AMP-binding protein n=1 Tax=Streptomyces sp. NPDC021080 TaxID=3365110 RepID=UPI0037AA8125
MASAVRPREATVGALVKDARQVAGALQGMGIKPGDVVAVQLPNWYEGAVAQTAVALCGAVLLPVVQIYGPRELDFILRQSGAVALVMAASWRGRDCSDVLSRLGELPDLRAVVVAGEGPVPESAVAWGDLQGALAHPFQPVERDPDDLAMLVYTSGTTADPKGVQHTHRTLVAEVRSAGLLRDSGADSMHLAVFPSGHVAGLLGLLRILILGCATVMMDAWDSTRAAQLIDRHRVTSSVGAPVHLIALLDAKERGEARLDSLREFMVGAASVPPVLIERADRMGIAAYRTYGSSEHPTISSGVPSDPLGKRSRTDGRATPGNEIRLVDDDGTDVPPGEEGEIVTRGPELFPGYRDERLNDSSFLSGGWFRTGDIGRLDADGYLTVTDRKKDIIVRGGENISSKEVEDVLATHPRVADAAAVGLPDERYGERVCAFVVLREGAELALSEVTELFRDAGVARQKTPEHLVVVEELPRTAAGKVQKFALRRRLADRSGPAH